MYDILYCLHLAYLSSCWISAILLDPWDYAPKAQESNEM